MTEPRPEPLVADTEEVASLSREIAGAGLCALDLEFVSEGRYVPELALLQLAWGPPDERRIAAVDPLAADPGSIFELIADESVDVVIHAARQDLALLSDRFGVEARAVWDSQIGAAFAGLGEQIGYARLVSRLLDAQIDKKHQFTDWLRRPLSDKQLRYALDDVRYLLPAWEELARTLEARGRLAWVREESQRLAASVSERREPEEMFRNVGGWNSLRGAALGALRALAAWRERTARRENKPPSWILSDGALIDLSRRQAKREADLRRARGVGGGTVRRYGRQILDTIAAGAAEPPPPPPEKKGLGPHGQAWSSVVTSLIQARCAAEELPARFVGTRADAEDLIRYVRDPESEEEPLLLRGWRRDVVGGQALAWLRGELAVTAAPNAPGGLRTVPSG